MDSDILIESVFRTLGGGGASILVCPRTDCSFSNATAALPRDLKGLVGGLNIPIMAIVAGNTFTCSPLCGGLRAHGIGVSTRVRYILAASRVGRVSFRRVGGLVNRGFAFSGFG